MQHVYDIIENMGLDGTQTLAEFMHRAGITKTPEIVPKLYGLIRGGRVVSALREFYTKEPVGSYDGVCCEKELMSTSHFHIDNYGNLFTGCCAGIVVGRLGDMHPEISEQDFPVFCKLCDEGPIGLMKMAEAECGYEPRPDGYISKCDLCLHVRAALLQTGKYRELTPEFFYRGI